MSDPFSELFRTLRVRSAVYFAHDFSAPWGMALPSRPYVQFHVALEGCCHVASETASLTLGTREVVLFPNGSAHAVSHDRGAPTRDGREVVQAIRRGEKPFPGKQPDVRLLSGHFEFDRAARHPLLRNLPDMLHVRPSEDFDVPIYKALAPLISDEASSPRPGAETIVERLAEIFLIQLLRVHFNVNPIREGLLGALFDSRLGASIAVMHARWAEPLTLTDLAEQAGMSRSAFAAAFRAAAGMTPMAYLAEWRLVKGRQMLADRERSVAQVAADCGHRSTEGFSRAFRRFYGLSPTKFRVAASG